MTIGGDTIESITSPVMMNRIMATATKRCCESDNAFSLREVLEAQLANECQPENDKMPNQQGEKFERAAPGRKVSIRDLISKQRCFGEEVKGRRDTLSILNEVDLDDSINFDDLTVYKVPSTDVEKESGLTDGDLTDQRSSLHSLTSESVDQFNPFDSIDDRKKASLLLGLSAEFSDLDEDDWGIGNVGAQPPILVESTELPARVKGSHGRRHGRRPASSQSSRQKSTASCHPKRERSKHEAVMGVVEGPAAPSPPARETRSIKPERDTLFPQEQKLTSTPAQQKKSSAPEVDLKKMFVSDSSVKSTAIKKLPSSAQNDLEKMFVVDVAASSAKSSHPKSLSTSRRGSSSHHHHSSLNRSMNRSSRSSSSSHKPTSKSSSSRSKRDEHQKSVFDSSIVSASSGEPNDSQVECKHRRRGATRTSQHEPARRRRSDASRDATISAIDAALHLCHAVAQDDDSDEIEVFAASKATRSRHSAHSSICSSADDQSRAVRSRRSSSSLRGRSDESTATPVPATPLKRRIRKSTRRTIHTNLLSEHMSRQSSDSMFGKYNHTPSVLSSGSDLASFFEMEPRDNIGKPVDAFHGEDGTRRSRNRAEDVIGTLYQ